MNLLLLLVLVNDLIDHVGGVLECFVEFVQLLASVGVVIVLEFFRNRRSVVDVGGEFVELLPVIMLGTVTFELLYFVLVGSRQEEYTW